MHVFIVQQLVLEDFDDVWEVVKIFRVKKSAEQFVAKRQAAFKAVESRFSQHRVVDKHNRWNVWDIRRMKVWE